MFSTKTNRDVVEMKVAFFLCGVPKKIKISPGWHMTKPMKIILIGFKWIFWKVENVSVIVYKCYPWKRQFLTQQFKTSLFQCMSRILQSKYNNPSFFLLFKHGIMPLEDCESFNWKRQKILSTRYDHFRECRRTNYKDYEAPFFFFLH